MCIFNDNMCFQYQKLMYVLLKTHRQMLSVNDRFQIPLKTKYF